MLRAFSAYDCGHLSKLDHQISNGIQDKLDKNHAAYCRNRTLDTLRRAPFRNTARTLRRSYAAGAVALDSMLHQLACSARPGQGLGGDAPTRRLRRKPSGREPELRHLRRPGRLSLPHAPNHAHHGDGPHLARADSGERVPEVHHPAPTRRPHLHLRRQDQQHAHVLCQSVAQEAIHRLSRRVGGLRRGVQLPRLAQLGHAVSG